MEDFSKPFSQMTKKELYEVIGKFRREMKSTLERNTTTEKELINTRNEIRNAITAATTLNKKSNSTNAAVEKRKENADKFFKERRNDLASLQATVESLMPQATLGNIAYSFAKAKLKYGDENDRGGFSFTRNVIVNIALYSGFILSLLSMILIFLLPFISLNPFTFDVPAGQVLTLEGTMSRFLLAAPLLWLALHMSSKISQRNALYEEYNYKERLLTTYLGFVDGFQDDKVKSQFTNELLKHINKPPSITKKKVYSETFMDLCSALIRRSQQMTEDFNEPSSTHKSSIARPPHSSETQTTSASNTNPPSP